jgi:transposase
MKNNKIDFSGQLIFIGLDVHKKSWSVTIQYEGIQLKTFSMNPDPEELLKYMQKNYPNGTYISVYEAGYCGYWIDRQLRSLGIKNMIVNPADVPTKNKEKRSKSDKIDSRKLARELGSNNIEGIYIPGEEAESIRALSRLRIQVTRDQTRLKNRIKSLLDFVGVRIPENDELKHWSGKFLTYLSELELKQEGIKLTLGHLIENLKQVRKELAGIIKDLREQKAGNERVNKIVNHLITVPGIGFITAITLYTEIIEIERFGKFDQLSCYVGLSPTTESSGESYKVLGLTNRHNRYLRNMLIESAWIVIRKDPVMTMVYGKLVQRMSRQEAIIRIAKKLLNRIMYVWRNEKDYVCTVVN